MRELFSLYTRINLRRHNDGVAQAYNINQGFNGKPLPFKVIRKGASERKVDPVKDRAMELAIERAKSRVYKRKQGLN